MTDPSAHRSHRGPSTVGRADSVEVPGRRRRRFRFGLVSPTGADVVAPERLDRGSLLRAMSPSLFTLANLMCGFSSILASIDGEYDKAAVLVALAILFDIADGAVARKVGAITPFGLQFDSLADLTSFGMAPALLLYNRSLFDMYWVGWFAAVLWIACAAFRLARFNVTIDPLADKRYFIGLASPGAAGVVIATVFAFDPATSGAGRWWPVLVAVVPALLMVSSFRFLAFRMLLTPAPGRVWVSVLVLVALVAGLAVAPAVTACVVAYGYVLSSPLGWATAPIRRRLFGPGAVAPPRHRLPSVFFPQPAEGSDGADHCDDDVDHDDVDHDDGDRDDGVDTGDAGR